MKDSKRCCYEGNWGTHTSLFQMESGTFCHDLKMYRIETAIWTWNSQIAYYFYSFFTIWSFPCPFEVAILTIKNPIYSINLLTKAMDYKVFSARFMGKSHHANVFVWVGNSTEVNACPLRRPYSGFVFCLSIAKYETDKESGDQSETDLWPHVCCSPLWSPEKVMG